MSRSTVDYDGEDWVDDAGPDFRMAAGAREFIDRAEHLRGRYRRQPQSPDNRWWIQI
jgi:hypothetical protein